MLDTILAIKHQEIEKLYLPERAEVERISFASSLKNTNYPAGLIAEVKKASPSKGIIREDFNHVMIGKQYNDAGVQAISVLTDQHFFQGHRDFLTDIKKFVDVPVMRKDFIIEPVQVEESKLIGADAILLIGEALEPKKLHELYLQAYESGLEVLVEVHSEDTLEGVLKEFTPEVLGINNRNLHTFETKLEQTEKMAEMAPSECLLVSESGIFTYQDIEQVVGYGAKGVLVGESLMRQKNIKKAVTELMSGVSV
ncbi:indole-3-glycerol phosphate synthase TrpC [Halobacillus sp. Marseille-Q1614]|uniref:indole-3-glycerol phosphate synthase TrpC n=1 Tax=Halobacillus sp. Marseille-Q1614 TaxID=2709134 RepID=UPI00156EB295|nr:indole-3-glycerol phosphate synthase TrpC [Halobacillus sp. Marseille-Q1614]